jgi:hypothetical protein
MLLILGSPDQSSFPVFRIMSGNETNSETMPDGDIPSKSRD